MKKGLIIFLTICPIYLVVKLSYPILSANYYNFIEYWNTKDAISWSKTRKIKWSDFNYNPNATDCEFHVFFTFGTRYNIESPYLFRSKTLFQNEKSYVCDTTNNNILRAVQARFDLLEVYRRRMVKEVENARKINKILSISYFEKLNQKYYSLFEIEFEEYSNREDKIKSLQELESRIKLELK